MTVRLSHRQKPDTSHYVFQALGSTFSLTGIAASLRVAYRMSIPDKIPYILSGQPATVSKLPPAWGSLPTYTITATTPVSAQTLPVSVPNGGSPVITVAWHSSSVPSTKPSWVTLTSGTSPTIAFTGDANQVDSADVSSMVLSATANGQTFNSGSTIIAVNAALTAGLNVTFNSNEGNANTGNSLRLTRGPMWYEGAWATKDGTLIEAFDGAHGSANQSNRIGEFDPTTGAVVEMFGNGSTNGVIGYDNTAYCYFDSIDSMVVYSKGVFNRATNAYNRAHSITDGSEWTHTGQAIAPVGRPPVYGTSPTQTPAPLIYIPSTSFVAGFEEQIGYYNVHTAYSRELDSAVIIGGSPSAGGPMDYSKLRLTIFIPSAIVSTSITARYYAIHRTLSQAQATSSGAIWMTHQGRSAIKFLGRYVYWTGGMDNTGATTRYLFRANVANIINSSDPANAPFTVERLADAPWSHSRSILSADPYSNALLLLTESGVALYDVTADSWSIRNSDVAEYLTTFNSEPLISYPHGDFVDVRSGSVKRKTYWYGGWNNLPAYASTSAPGYDARFNQVRSVKVTRGPENWATRSTGSGVLWAHDFSESDSEVELFTFTGGMNGTNVDPTTIPNVIKRTASIGPTGGYALRTKLIGNTLTSPTPSGVAGNSHVFNVSSASDFPDPGVVGPYTIFIGDPSDKNVQPYEAVTVTARNTGANTLTVTRRINSIDYPRQVLGVSYPYPQAASFPAGWSIGMNQGGEWRRPLVPFAALSNGKSTDDAGIANGAKRAGAAYSWSTTRGSQNHYFFRRGYYGSPYYWDTSVNPSAKWATTWNASDYTASSAQGNIFEGDEFYLQFRVKVSENMMTQHESKFFYLHNATNGGHAQIWGQVGRNKQGEVQLSSEVIPGVTYGHMITLFCQGGDGRAVDGKGYMISDTLASGFGGTTRWQTDYPASGSSPSAGSFCWPGDRWVTFLMHVKFGRDNAENLPVDTSSFNIHAPYPADTNPSYRTTVELQVHMQGWSEYKKVIGNFNYPWWFGDGISDTNYFPYNPAGMNAIWMSPFSNLYQNTGGEPPHPSTVTIDYAQVICSKKPIAPPSD